MFEWEADRDTNLAIQTLTNSVEFVLIFSKTNGLQHCRSGLSCMSTPQSLSLSFTTFLRHSNSLRSPLSTPFFISLPSSPSILSYRIIIFTQPITNGMVSDQRCFRLSIQALLGAPNPDDPLANDVAQNWKEDEKAAIAQAKEWTRIYAQ